MRIFLAGATGMVGSSIIRNVLAQYPHWQIRAAQHHTSPLIQHAAIEYKPGDLNSLEDCQRWLEGCDCAVMAVAAEAGGAASFAKDPLAQVYANTGLYLNFLRAVKASSLKRVIWIGSITLYQDFQGEICESDLDLNAPPSGAHFGVGWLMRFMEQLCQTRSETGPTIINVRLANVFGPYARFDPQRSNFIPALIRKAIAKLEPFEVWGHPSIARDVLYADDCGRAICLLLEADYLAASVYNVGGLKTTVGEVVTHALQAAGYQPQTLRYLAERPTSMQFRALDCTQIKTAVGWTPQVSIPEGIRLTTQWWVENQQLWNK